MKKIERIKKLSPRTSIVVTTLARMGSKVTGYVRYLLIAYLFGISAGMDAYSVAVGAVGLAMGLATSVVRMCVVPHLMRLSAKDEVAARSFFAWVARFVVGWGALVLIVLMIFPTEYLSIFAGNLDANRMSTAADMLRILLPMGYAQLLGALLIIWANYRKAYSVGSIVNFVVSPPFIILLVLLAPHAGVYAVALSASITAIALTVVEFSVLRDIPFKAAGEVPREILGKTGRDAIMCFGVLGAGFLYGVTDRWFAAGLEAGNISAISYSDHVMTLVTSFTAVASQMQLTHSSGAAGDAARSKKLLNTSLAIGWAYILPIAAATVALSTPIITVVLGHGAFDEKAIAITASCLMVSSVALPFMVWNTVLTNFGIATSRLKQIVFRSYGTVLLNVFLDWLFTPIWGAAGICAATALNRVMIAVYYMHKIAPRGVVSKQIPDALKQMLFAAVWGVGLYCVSDYVVLSVLLGGMCALVHVFFCEYMGWMSQVPEAWRPRALLSMILKKLS